MPQKQFSKNHHYIPEFYLKRWTSGGELVQFSKPHGNIVKPRRVYPSQTGFVRKLYALEGVPDELSSKLEDEYFKPVDTRAADALTTMESQGTVITDIERVGWGQFLLSLVFRHPENVSAVKERFRNEVLIVTPESERRWKRTRKPTDPPTLKEVIEEQVARDPTRVSRAALDLLAGAVSNEKVGQHLVNMIWGSLTLPIQLPALFTSDRPVHWFSPLSAPGCHIVMPIGPKKIFWAANTDEMAMWIRTRPVDHMVEFINQQTIRRAQNYVYAMTDKRLSYVQALMGINPEKTIADIAILQPSPKIKINSKRKILRDL